MLESALKWQNVPKVRFGMTPRVQSGLALARETRALPVHLCAGRDQHSRLQLFTDHYFITPVESAEDAGLVEALVME